MFFTLYIYIYIYSDRERNLFKMRARAHTHKQTHIYIYIYREREREWERERWERERERIYIYIYIYIWRPWSRATRRLPFHKLLLLWGVGNGGTHLPGLLHFTLDRHLLMQSFKQGGIKNHFWVFGMTRPGNKTLVSPAIGKHTTHSFLKMFKIDILWLILSSGCIRRLIFG